MSKRIQELLNGPEQPPKFDGWSVGATSEWDGTTGFIQTGPMEERPKTWDEFIRDAGLDPEEVEIVGDVQLRGWDSIKREVDEDGNQVSNKVRMHYYRITVRRRSQALPDLQNLILSARQACPHQLVGSRSDSAMVVVLGDWQVGKALSSRGGTPELMERLASYLEQVKTLAQLWGCKESALLDAGDIIEGIESGGGLDSQLSTNDLSLMDQVDVAAVMEFEFLKLLADTHDKVSFASVGSNHCRYRRGKTNLGRPIDDWGIFIAKQIKHRLDDNPDRFGHVKTYVPAPNDESLTVDLAGLRVGLAHGHQSSNPDRVPDWWAKQTHGGQPVWSADLLVTGHFHHFRVQPTGMHPIHRRSKWWIQAPTADAGSDWFRLAQGSDSEPGMLVFRVDGSGWHDLTLLRNVPAEAGELSSE